jgi:stage II sporulation protein AA (anti-sigma F factor antagonist)
MRLTSFLDNGSLTVVLTGEIDHHCAKELIQGITGKIEAYKPHSCTLDFQEVTFMDSSGIAVVINTLRTLSQMNGELCLTGLHNQPMKVFRASGIDKLVQIKETVS